MTTSRRKAEPRRKLKTLVGINVVTLVVVVVVYWEWSSTKTLLSHEDERAFSLPPFHASVAVSQTTTAALDPPPAFDSKPANWTFQFLQEQFPCPEKVDLTRPRIIFYHIQHHAGTSFFHGAVINKECAPRACRQKDKQCLVSYSEKIEAENIRSTRMSFIPYEIMLPKHFPLPFVNEREGFFFTTIMRHPIDRLKTVLRRQPMKQQQLWYLDETKSNDPYHIDNLSVRWLAGVTNNRQITEQDLTLAKCRLELFDLVITDKTHMESMLQVVCPLRDWKRCKKVFEAGHKSNNDSLLELDPVVIGAWIERQRPSFELYDYARRLSVHQLQTRYGISSRGDLLRKRSFVETMEKYANVTCQGPIKRYNELKMNGPHVPVSGCEEYHRLWASNQDLVPKIWGLNTILENPQG
jgi:hypothetical protein